MDCTMAINIPDHERTVPDVNVYCAACPERWELRCRGYGGEAVPPCSRMKNNAAGDVTPDGEWLDPPIAEDSPALIGKQEIGFLKGPVACRATAAGDEAALAERVSPALDAGACQPDGGRVLPQPGRPGSFYQPDLHDGDQLITIHE